MTTIEGLREEIAALKEALGIVENRVGDHIYTDMLVLNIKYLINAVEELHAKRLRELPVDPYEPEFDKYDALGI
jgi:hypothetical protein